MTINMNNNLSFGSTRIPNNNVLFKKYWEPLNKNHIRLIHCDLMKPQDAADKLDSFSKAAAMFDEKGMIIVGKGGGPDGVDTFIGKLLQKVSPDVKYVDDIKPVKFEKFEGPVIDLNI